MPYCTVSNNRDVQDSQKLGSVFFKRGLVPRTVGGGFRAVGGGFRAGFRAVGGGFRGFVPSTDARAR